MTLANCTDRIPVSRADPRSVTRNGKTIAVVVPGSGVLGRYVPLIARGIIRIRPTTTRELDRLPSYAVPEGTSPLDVLLAEREADGR